jgi:hypothetical protein
MLQPHFGPHFLYLFNDIDGNSGYTASNDWTVVNNQLERTSKETVITEFKVPFRHLPTVLRKTMKNSSRYRCGGRDLNRVSQNSLRIDATCSVQPCKYQHSSIL